MRASIAGFRSIAPLAATFAVASGVLAGPAAAAEPRGGFMPLGRTADAPLGFLDLCRREAEACATAGQDRDAVAREATRLYWNAVFGGNAALGARPAALNAAPARAVSAAATASAGDKAGSVGLALEIEGAPLAPWRAPQPESAPGAAALVSRVTELAAASPPRAFVAAAEWKTVERINRSLNGAVRKASDQRLHGQADYWTTVSRPGQGGDCEDYVLTKRAALIAAGVPESALSIALVRTSWGEDHAVLLVAAEDGERVLDNLTSRILPWRRVRYTWDQRQLPGRPMMWVQGPAFAPDKR